MNRPNFDTSKLKDTLSKKTPDIQSKEVQRQVAKGAIYGLTSLAFTYGLKRLLKRRKAAKMAREADGVLLTPEASPLNKNWVAEKAA